MPKRTYQPNKRRRLKKFGFLKRMRSLGGRNIIKRRRRKCRSALSVSEEMKIHGKKF